MSNAPESTRIRERFARLLEASIDISRRHTLGEVLQCVVSAAAGVVGARYAALGVLGPDGSELIHFETTGVSAEDRAAIGTQPRGHGLLGAVIRDARPVRLPRIGDDPRSVGFPANHPPMASFLGVPIAGRDRVFGNLYLTDKVGADEFTEEDESIAVLLAAQAAVAVENARLYEDQADLLDRLDQLRRQRDQFFAMMNHELRNALTGVYGWAEQAQRARGEAAARHAIGQAHESAERTITLMNNLLDLSRLDAGRTHAVLAPTDLGLVVRRAVAAQRPAAGARDLRLVIELPAEPVELRTDGMRLEQILVNLLSNAVRHSHPGDEITVRLERTEDTIRVTVSDRGPGISDEDQVKIFEPYVRVDPQSGLGSGLGLPVSRRLAELIGGSLTVSSGLGRGAAFTVTLPADQPAGEHS